MENFLASQSLTLLISGSVLSAIICYLAIRIGIKYSLVAKESFRRHKNEFVPLLGGTGIYFSAALVNIFLQDAVLWKILIAGVPLMVIGIWDDLREISARFKFGAQCLSALLWINLVSPQGVVYTKITGSVVLGVMLTVLFLVTLENAFNFVDGSDGLAGMLGLTAFLTLGLSYDPLGSVGLLFSAGVIGFLYFNFPPAKLYLGEVGSSFVGFATGAMATLLPVHDSGWTAFWAINFIFALPFCDLILAVVRRLAKGLAPWSPDKRHFHHKLQALGMNRKMVLATNLFISAIASVTAFTMLKEYTTGVASFLVGFVSASSLVFIYVGFHVAEKIWGKRVSMFGRQIIEKYLPIDKSEAKYSLNQRCVLIDLLPYFSEIQSRGIPDVDRFALDFGQWAVHVDDLQSIRLVGSYSVALVLAATDTKEKTWQNKIRTELNKLLLQHRVLRNMSLTPEGVYFYDGLRSPEVQRLLNIRSSQGWQEKKSAG